MLIKEHAATSCPQKSSHIISPQIALLRSEQLEQCSALLPVCLKFNTKMSISSHQQIQPLRMANQSS